MFFRNNHFSTLYKHKGELFLLVTDQGFLTEPAVIWETLVNIEGDGQFVNSEYRSIQLESNATQAAPVVPFATAPQSVATVTETTPPIATSNVPQNMANLSQEDQDYLIALSLQQERSDSDSVVQQTATIPALLPGGGDANSDTTSATSQFDRDHQLALQLQEDEDRRAQQQQQQSASQHQQQQSQQQQQPPQQSQQQQPPQQSQQRPQQEQSQQQQREQGQQEGDKCSIL